MAVIVVCGFSRARYTCQKYSYFPKKIDKSKRLLVPPTHTCCPPAASLPSLPLPPSQVSHAYHVLLHGGLLPEKMVVMMADDIAMNPLNPYPGVIVNRPGGRNVYEGVAIDYRGDDVTADVFLAVLLGDEREVRGVGTERVVSVVCIQRGFDRTF